MSATVQRQTRPIHADEITELIALIRLGGVWGIAPGQVPRGGCAEPSHDIPRRLEAALARLAAEARVFGGAGSEPVAVDGCRVCGVLGEERETARAQRDAASMVEVNALIAAHPHRGGAA
ncbi:hypothetical protein [Streptomyces sp. NPDC001985]|uniref:hypothetical protein n=1 Tax=Streptomyces sp. NPDC001985 TaxID=3154406 RepID=UPI00333198BF